MTNAKAYSDENFAIVPEWVMYAPISSNAVRLYCVMRRFADQTSKLCYPTRKTIADRCQFSPASVDRAMEELKAIGAIIVTNRRSAQGDWTSNLYKVVASDPKRSPARDETPTAGDETGLSTGDEQTRANKNESQRTKVSRSPNSEQARGISQAWWEKQDRPTGKFIALQKIIERTLDAGWEPQIVSQALGTFVVIPSLAQLELQIKGRRGTQTKYDRNRQVLEQTLRQQQKDAIRLAFDALDKGKENE
jgi:hypothetical protein